MDKINSRVVTDTIKLTLPDIALSWEKALFELRKIKSVTYTTKTGIQGISLTRVNTLQEKIFKAIKCPVPKLKHL